MIMFCDWVSIWERKCNILENMHGYFEKHGYIISVVIDYN